MKKKTNVFGIVSYVFLIVSCVLVLFPFFYSLSLSFQDYNAIYSVPPKIMPTIGKNLSLTLNLTDDATLERSNPEAYLDQLKKISATALLSSFFETRGENIDHYQLTVEDGNQIVLKADAHTILLQLEMDYGLFKNVMITKDTILKQNRYDTFMNSIHYEYNPNGLAKPAEKIAEAISTEKFSSTLEKKYDIPVSQQKIVYEKGSVMSKFENYIYYFKLPQYVYKDYQFVAQYGFFAFLFNTILTVLAAMVTQVTIPAITAYPMAVLFPKKTANRIMTFFLITMMIPFVCIMIPQLVLFKRLGLYDTYGALLVPWLLPAPFYIFLYKGFFEELPKSLFEAAKIDGAGEFTIFTKICIPLCKPIVSLIAIQSFISGWTDFFWYYLSTKNLNLATLNLAMYYLNKLPTAKTNYIMGLSICIMIPVIFIAIVFSKQIKESVVGSGIKG